MQENKIDYPFISINELKPYENNARLHPQEQINKIVNSIKEFGFITPVIIDENNTILVGHGRTQAAKAAGLTKVPYRRITNLTDEQKRAYILADNKLSDIAEWDEELLQMELDNISLDMTAFGFDEFNIDIDEDEAEVVEDEVPEVPTEAKAQLGDLYKLGEHRLLCGDSTNVLNIDILMNGKKADMVFTDPPYGVSANGGRGDTKKKLQMQAIINDELRDTELCDFLKSHFSIMPIKAGASIYICYPWATQEEFTKAIRDSGYKLQNCIIWRKNVFGLNGFKGYRPQYEMIYFCSKGDYQWYGDLAQSNVWDFNRSTEHIGNHPTPKPVELICKAIKNSSKQEDIIYDGFGGSGSTLIACEQLGRKCYMIELDPIYIDVIIERWENLTGQKAELIKGGE